MYVHVPECAMELSTRTKSNNALLSILQIIAIRGMHELSSQTPNQELKWTKRERKGEL